MFKGSRFHSVAVMSLLAVAVSLSGCASYPRWLPGTGPGSANVEATEKSNLPIKVVEVNDSVARRLHSQDARRSFSEAFRSTRQPANTVNYGDVLAVSIWEAPPATLFAASSLDSGLANGGLLALPEQMVNESGTITVPFVGSLDVTGKTPHEIETDISDRLRGKAHQPQAMVRVVQDTNTNVTIVGEVTQSRRMPLTPSGEKLLDALAEAGGVKQPVDKVTVQLTRGEHVESLPLESIIKDPAQNVTLLPGDVITAMYQPLSFTVLGAAGKNEEINFETQGITLAQALARAGGVLDNRSDSRGVFVFRFENPELVEHMQNEVPLTPEGTLPVVYRIDLSNPATFFVAQNFPMRDKDVVYVANASGYELQKFLNLIFTGLYPTLTIYNATK